MSKWMFLFGPLHVDGKVLCFLFYFYFFLDSLSLSLKNGKTIANYRIIIGLVSLSLKKQRINKYIIQNHIFMHKIYFQCIHCSLNITNRHMRVYALQIRLSTCMVHCNIYFVQRYLPTCNLKYFFPRTY